MLCFRPVLSLGRHCLLCRNLCSTFFVTWSILCSREVIDEGGKAHIDLMSVLNTSPSCRIPNRSNTPATIIVIEQRKLQVIHLVLLALVHHLCASSWLHSLGPVLHPRLHSLSMNRRSAKHIPFVVESGILKKESIASPKVTRVGSRDLTTAIIILEALIRLQHTTTIMIPSENCTLHFSGVLSLLHPIISLSPILGRSICHGSPLVTFEASSLGLHRSPLWLTPAGLLRHIQRLGDTPSGEKEIQSRKVSLCVALDVRLVIRNRFLLVDKKSVL